MHSKLGRDGGYVLTKNKKDGEQAKVLVSRDTRISGQMLEYALISIRKTTFLHNKFLIIFCARRVFYFNLNLNTAGIGPHCSLRKLNWHILSN